MSKEADVSFERADSVTVYLSPEVHKARIVLFEFLAEHAERLEIGAWEFSDYPADDWESVLNLVGPWLNRHGLGYEGEAAWDTREPMAPTATLYQFDERPRR